tara:strand:+ start:1575 stop:1871 length:297 start_codon:yes stop_codon:yes gene_type:complete
MSPRTQQRKEARRAARKRRKWNEAYWSRQPEPMEIIPKGRVKTLGNAIRANNRDKQFAGGEWITVEPKCQVGQLNSTGTAYVSRSLTVRNTGKTWVRC